MTKRVNCKVRSEFEIQGFFYKIENYKCRKFLNIKRKSSDRRSPDLMVVMMNPGSSCPLDGIDNNNSPVDAKPDNTQDQIMKVMRIAEFEYARVLNLSDLRTPKSNEFYDFIKSNESKLFAHSIFAQNRINDFSEQYVKGVPVIFGWGVNPILADLAKQAIERINHLNPAGLKKEDLDYAYYHPLPRINDKKIEWVEKITKMLVR